MDSCQHTSTWDCPSFDPFIWRSWLLLTPFLRIPTNIHLLFGILTNIHLLGMDSCQHTSTWDCPSFHPFIWHEWLLLAPFLTSLMSELSCRLSYKSTKREKDEFRGAIDILPLRLTSLEEALHYQALRSSTEA